MASPEFPQLQTDRLLFRQIIPSDIDNIYRGLSDPQIIRYYGVSFDSLEATKEQMQFYTDLEQNGTGIWWAICSPDNRIFYGAGGLNNLSKAHRKAEIGFWLLTDYWRKGIMSEALPVICHYGFSRLKLHRIEGFVETGNINCKKALSKLDFHLEGTMKDCEIKNGVFISLDIYARLNNGEEAELRDH